MADAAPLRVCIIGGGAAGMAAAWSLSKHPGRFEAVLFDPAPVLGGVATSETPHESYSYINDGVQAAAPSYKNALRLFAEVGARPTPLKMKISFNKGDENWSNYRDTPPFMQNLKEEIDRFEGVLQDVMNSEKFYILWSIRGLLKHKGFSEDFMNKMVFPLTALFFGTGNQTPNVSAVIFARVFFDPKLRLFDYDKERLLAQMPTMYAFPNLRDMYRNLGQEAMKSGNVKIFSGCGVKRIDRTKEDRGGITVVDELGRFHVFDRVISACDAETANRLFRTKGFCETRMLNNVEYFDDITVTHTDYDYMRKMYDIDLQDLSRGDQYFIHTYPDDRSKLEMSFDLTQYQPQLQPDLADASKPHVFQTIYLDAAGAQRWTIGDVDESKVMLRKWWRQFGHTWRHYVTVVPWVRFAQGSYNTFYAGSWTLVNTHEIAVISGLAAAWRLGADYPFQDDELALHQFDQYLEHMHGKKYTPVETPRALIDMSWLTESTSTPTEPVNNESTDSNSSCPVIAVGAVPHETEEKGQSSSGPMLV